MDYTVAIADAQPLDLIYMDPPYQGVSGDRDGRYLAGLAFDKFAQSLEKLNQRGLPERYTHVAMLAQRRLDIVWAGDEVAQYEATKEQSAISDMPMPEDVKQALKKFILQ